MGKSIGDLSIGIEYNYVKDVKEKLDFAVDKGANYICSKLVPQSASEECIETGVPVPCEEYWNDTAITTKEWTLGVIGLLPNPPQLESQDLVTMKRATKALNRQLEYCHHLAISAVMFELNHPSYHLAQLLQGRLYQLAQHFTFWIKVQYGTSGSGLDEQWDVDTWKWYNTFRKLCGGERKLMAVLRLNADIPDDERQLDRWKGEMVTAISIPISIFLTNDSGFPVLSKSHQAVLHKFLVIGVHLILEVDIPETKDLSLYIKYLRHLHTIDFDVPGIPLYEYRNYAPGYENYLQCPLQPLQDNLEYQTYAVFEIDPVKYALYREAMALAFKHKLPTVQQRETTELVVVVAGAGRGPLVKMAIEAARAEGVKIKLYALEKNRSAEVRLHHLNATEWDKKVTIVIGDMRYWDAPEKMDIIISELLGSFGDNELSPECLDGAQRFLKDDGIMIPQEYTSFLAPVMSHTLHAEAKKYRDSEKPFDAPFETQYVCYMTRKYDIAPPKEVFKFRHPVQGLNLKEAMTNDRYTTLEFDVNIDCDCHGFAGYFDSILFGTEDNNNVTMSILPTTYSRGMQSWFPLYIPIRSGVSLRKGDKLVVGFWRKSTSTKVWYEWAIVSPQTLPVHNVNGRSSFFGLDLAQTE